MLVESQRRIVAVYVQLHRAGAASEFPDNGDRVLEQLASQPAFLKGGQHVDFLQMEQPGTLSLDGDIAGRLVVLAGDVLDVPLPFHLVAQAFGRVHPFHHVVRLLPAQNLAVRGRKSLPCHFANQGYVGRRRFSYRGHCGKY